MKVAIIGSRGLTVKDLGKYLPESTTEIISGGAIGIDSCAKQYALKKNISFTEFLPQYELYGKRAPLVRNRLIAEYSDIIIAFWDKSSKGTAHTLSIAKSLNKAVYVYVKSNVRSSDEFILMK